MAETSVSPFRRNAVIVDVDVDVDVKDAGLGPSFGATLPEDRTRPLASDDLLRGRRMVEIAHNGEVYRLQATRLGKLILTK